MTGDPRIRSRGRFAIGYGAFPNAGALASALSALDVARVIDCRARPTSRNASFRPGPLARMLTAERLTYEQRGAMLGGYPPGATKHSTTAAGLAFVESLPEGSALLCACRYAAACHLHSLIGRAIRAPGLCHVQREGPGSLLLVCSADLSPEGEARRAYRLTLPALLTLDG